MDEMLIHVLITFKEEERKLRYSKCPRIQSHQSVCKRPIYPVSLFKTRKTSKFILQKYFFSEDKMSD